MPVFPSQGDPLEIDVEAEEHGSFEEQKVVRQAADAAAAAVKEELRAEMTQHLAEARAASLHEIETVVRHELADIRSVLAVLVPGAITSSQGSLPHASVAAAGTSAGTCQVAPSHERVARVRRNRRSRDAVSAAPPAQAPLQAPSGNAPPPLWT